MPRFGVEVDAIKDVNLKRKLAVAVNFPDIEIEFLDSPERDVAAGLEAWFNEVWDSGEGTMGLKSEYAKDNTPPETENDNE